MSPSWRESLDVLIGPAEVRVRRLSRGWQPREIASAASPIVPCTRAGIAEALATACAAVQGAPADARVVISSEWIRLGLIRDAKALRGSAEQQAAAAHTLRRIYGDSAADWRVAFARQGRDTLIAVGIEAALFGAIASALEGAQCRLVSLAPLFADSLNRCRSEIRGPAWFVAAESTRVVLGYSDGAGLRNLRSHRINGELEHELPAWIEQGRVLDGIEPDASEVIVALSLRAPLDAQRLPFAVRQIALDAPSLSSPQAST